MLATMGGLSLWQVRKIDIEALERGDRDLARTLPLEETRQKRPAYVQAVAVFRLCA
jgi:hypothetical protein